MKTKNLEEELSIEQTIEQRKRKKRTILKFVILIVLASLQ